MENLSPIAVQIILGILLLVGTIGGSYLSARAGMKRIPFQNELDESQMTQITVQSTKLLLEPLNQKIIELETKVKLDKAESDRKIEEMNGTYHVEFDLTVGGNPVAQITRVSKNEGKEKKGNTAPLVL